MEEALCIFDRGEAEVEDAPCIFGRGEEKVEDVLHIFWARRGKHRISV